MLIMLAAAAAALSSTDGRCGSMKTDDLVACAEAERRRADADLNRVYADALRQTRSADAALASARAVNGGLSYSQALIASERAWIAFRDAECRTQTYASYDGHELPIYQRGCLTDLTRERTRQLRVFLSPR